MNRFGTTKGTATMIWFLCKTGEPKIMLAKRLAPCKTFVGYWAAAGGKVDSDECAISAAQRETQEETGMKIARDQFKLVDCFVEDDFRCFLFEVHLPLHRFNEIKNTEPDKHTPWEIFTVQEALKLPRLMPALRKLLLTKA